MAPPDIPTIEVRRTLLLSVLLEKVVSISSSSDPACEEISLGIEELVIVSPPSPAAPAAAAAAGTPTIEVRRALIMLRRDPWE